MNVVLTLACLLSLSLRVESECPGQQTKDLLRQYKVNQPLIPLLSGKTYTGYWRNKKTTDLLDCAVIEFTKDGDNLLANMQNVQHDEVTLVIPNRWIENKGDSSFSSYWSISLPGKGVVRHNEYVHVFYADKYALGYYSCDMATPGLQKMAISVRNEGEKKALKSFKNAEKIMKKLEGIIIPDSMDKFTRKHCP